MSEMEEIHGLLARCNLWCPVPYRLSTSLIGPVTEYRIWMLDKLAFSSIVPKDVIDWLERRAAFHERKQ